MCDHVRNSHDHSVLQSIDITRRNLMLITLRAFKWVNKEWICFSSILWTERNGPLIFSLYLFISLSLFSRHWFLLSVSNTILNYFLKGRRRVVPHFSSGTVQRPKRGRSWRSSHARIGDTRWGERRGVSYFLAWGKLHARSRFARSTIPEER